MVVWALRVVAWLAFRVLGFGALSPPLQNPHPVQ